MADLSIRVSTTPDDLRDYNWVQERLAEFDARLFTARRNRGTVVLAALAGDDPVGAITFYERLGWTHIERLWVEPGRRRQGLGTKLIQECESRTVNDGRIGLRVTTTSGHSALGLYLALGFHIDGRWPIHSGRGVDLEEIGLSKRFSPAST